LRVEFAGLLLRGHVLGDQFGLKAADRIGVGENRLRSALPLSYRRTAGAPGFVGRTPVPLPIDEPIAQLSIRPARGPDLGVRRTIPYRIDSRKVESVRLAFSAPFPALGGKPPTIMPQP
jgi:hypothetical protein